MKCQPSRLLKCRRREDESGAKFRLFMAVGRLLYRVEDILTVAGVVVLNERHKSFGGEVRDLIQHVIL